jgi:hypothetical protein
MQKEPELEKLRYRLNLILIAGLCSTTLAPCLLFYFTGEGEIEWAILFVGISYLVSLAPKGFYGKFQISTDLTFYQKLGVDQFKKISTMETLPLTFTLTYCSNTTGLGTKE